MDLHGLIDPDVVRQTIPTEIIPMDGIVTHDVRELKAHPPFSQIPQGSVLFVSAREPFCFSKAQKNRVSFG